MPITPNFLYFYSNQIMCVCVKLLQLCMTATLWTVAHQAPLSMGFSRQQYWSELPCPPPGDLPDPGIKPVFPATPALQVDSLMLNHQGSPNQIICVPNSIFLGPLTLLQDDH